LLSTRINKLTQLFATKKSQACVTAQRKSAMKISLIYINTADDKCTDLL